MSEAFDEYMRYLEANEHGLREIPPGDPELPRLHTPPMHVSSEVLYCVYCPVPDDDYHGTVIWELNLVQGSYIGWCRTCGQRYETVER